MAFSKNPLLFLYTLLSLETVTTENCALDSDHGFLKYRDACFFAIKDSTQKANLKINETHYKFDIDTARRGCREVNATLPIFRRQEDQRLLRQHFRSMFNNSKLSVTGVALDVVQDMSTDSIEHKWSDGSSITYTGSWLNKDATSLCTVMHLDSNGQWENVQGDFGHALPVGVVCQKQSRHKRSPVDDSGTMVRVCNQNQQPDDLIQPFVYKDACYFAVNTAADQANTAIADKFLFNITKARDICQRYNATLPTIQNNDENSFLIGDAHMMVQEFLPALFILALGLQQHTSGENYSYVWDDGQAMKYEFTWPNKFSKAAYTVMEISSRIRQTDKNLPSKWVNVPDDDYLHDQAVFVVCEQPHASNKTTTPKPAPATNTSKCDGGNTKQYPRVAVYAGKACYFTVSGSFSKLNEFENYYFNIWKAREICSNESATLPVVESEDEYKFINSTFSNMDLAETAHKRVRFIALDLQQTTNLDTYQYSDGRPPPYQPDVWEGKGSYAYYITMSLDKVAFRNHAGNEINVLKFDNLVGIICKQPHFSTSQSSQRETQAVTAAWSSSITTSALPTAPTSSGPALTQGTTVSRAEPDSPREYSTHSPVGIPKGNKCGIHTRGYYQKTAQYADQLCYFVIKNATTDAILASSEGRFKKFLANARESCKAHDATLPIVHSKAEAIFILDHFSVSDFLVGGRMELTKGIALDMNVELRDGGLQYTWQDGKKLSYEPPKWSKPIRKYGHAWRVFMHFRAVTDKAGMVTWETDDGSGGKVLAVLCQQQLEAFVVEQENNGECRSMILSDTIIFILSIMSIWV